MNNLLRLRPHAAAVCFAVAGLVAAGNLNGMAAPKKVTTATAPAADGSDAVKLLIHDKVVDEAKGFVIEKKNNQLLVNGKALAAPTAAKYLPLIPQATFKYQVYSFGQRLQMHPNTSVMEMIAPVMFSSPCIAKTPSGPGC
ncbi:MAG: hypothetical protein EBZ77_16610 [Chitinophagia bacterium]|nr:hypothetical protein [Chitinophagia bacterium]